MQAPLESRWSYFADWWDLPLALVALMLIALAGVWWRQTTRHWLRVMVLTFLGAFALNLSSLLLFVVPPHGVACQAVLCTGWSGYPLRVALLPVAGGRMVGQVDFVLNLLLLWLLVLGASMLATVAAVSLQWWRRSWSARLLIVGLLVFVPWMLLPRALNPPQPSAVGEQLRLANNARRAAEFTYGITGLWVQRLALEDMRSVAPPAGVVDGDPPAAPETRAATEVCLRGYTYFYLPWRRYRIALDANGVTAVDLVELPLRGSRWNEPVAP